MKSLKYNESNELFDCMIDASCQQAMKPISYKK